MCSRSPGSTGGQFAIARISEVSGSITIAVAPSGEYVSPTLDSTFSVSCWITGSSVSWTSSPSLRFLHVFHLDRLAERVGDDAAFAFFAGQRRLLALLDPGQPLAFVADDADHLAGHFALRVGPAAGGQLADPFEAQFFDLLRGGQVDVLGEVGEARFDGQLFQHLAFFLFQDRRQQRRRFGRIFHLVGRRVDRRRVFGGGEAGAVAVEDRAAQAGNVDRLGLLVERLRGQLRGLHPLQPEGTADDDEEGEQEAGEEQADASLDQAHPAAIPGWRRRPRP